MSTAVVTIVRDRTAHLANVLRGLGRQTRAPDEVVVAVMGGEDPEDRVPDVGLSVRYVRLDPEPGRLPLAEARNAGAEAATAEHLVFLDVDCIPGATLVARYAEALSARDALLMGEVRYLDAGATDGDWTEADLVVRSRPHPARVAPGGEGPVATDRYELFWSLSFGVRRATFLDRIGGFDPDLDGYGGEDTDLAFSARAAGVPLAWLPGAVAFHQHHDTYDPPLQHLVSIVRNARAFRAKWGVWPMEGWLTRFDELGLVRFEPDADVLDLRRGATAEELERAKREQVVAPASAD